MQIHTKKLLQILPMDEDIRTSILSRYDNMNASEQWEVTKVCWLMFQELFKSYMNAELEKVLDPNNPDSQLKNDLYAEIEKKVYKTLMDKVEKTEQITGLDDVRKKLNALIQSPSPAQDVTS